MVAAQGKSGIAPPPRRRSGKQTERDVTFNRTLGANAPDLIANLVVSGTIPAIEELAANAYDADATRVDIDYRPELNVLSIRDNGSGMTAEEGLDSFYRLGDSPKVKQPISPEGRVRIGKFGVATILLRSLAEEYKLTTQRDGRKTFVYETLENRVTSDKPITGREVTVDSDAHGTQLLLSRLKFKEGENFSVEELRRRMQWDLPILPDFQITINGEPVASKSIENATVFKVDKEGKHMGAIHGNLYLSSRKSPMPGIHVYVNGRKIGDPKTFFKGERFGATNQLVGIIHADGLEDAILFDRGRFREDHPGVIELGGVIEKAINAVEQYSRRANEGSMKGKVLASKSSMLKKTQSHIARTKLGGADRSTTIEFSDSLARDVPGHYASDMNAIYLNSKHPSLQIDGATTVPRYEQAILGAVVDAMALSESQSSKDPLKSFLKRRSDLWAQLTATSAQDEVKTEIHPMVMYQLSDLARITDRNLGAMRYLAEGEAFPVSEDGVLGKDFAEMQKTTRGFTTLYELLHGKTAERNGTAANFGSVIDRFHKILEGAGDVIVPFAYRLGSDKAQPCYVVEETCTDRVYNILRSPAMDMRRADADPKRAFAEAYNEVHTIPELAKATSTNIDDVTKVIGFAKSRSLKIEVSRATPVRFRFGDYVRVLQVRRKEDYERSDKAKH